ncbi:MAG: hypothetical protein IJ748_05525 [Bacteroidales bacterium]|nr:hypothetical protein [Bacteroidales bacterium]
MKKVCIVFMVTNIIFLFLGINKVYGQDKDSIQSVFVQSGIVYAESPTTYKIYPMKNMYNFLKLNTVTGEIEGVQWSFKESERFTYTINGEKLISTYNEGINDRFELYPTENIHTFILLDKIDGRVWQVYIEINGGKYVQRIY